MLSDDIQIIEKSIDYDLWTTEVDSALQRIKTAIAELGTTPNKPIMPVCPACNGVGYLSNGISNFATERCSKCEGTGKPAQVG